MAAQQVPSIFAPERIAMRRMRAERLRAKRADAALWLAETIGEDVLERVAFMQLEPKSALVAGSGASTVAAQLRASGCDTRVRQDADFSGEPGQHDLIVSLAQLDTINDLPGVLIQARMTLARGGIFMASLLGAGSVPMLRQIMLAADDDRPSPRIHPQIDNQAATMLLERAGFARQVVDGHRLTVRFGSLDSLLSDLREQAITSVLATPPMPIGKAGKARAEAAFEALADADGKVSEHFELLTLTGWNS